MGDKQMEVEAELGRRVQLAKTADPSLTKQQAVAQVLQNDPELYSAWKAAREALAETGPSLRNAVHGAVHKRAIAIREPGEELGDAVVRALKSDPDLSDAYRLAGLPAARLETDAAVTEISKRYSGADAFAVRSTLRKALGLGAPSTQARREALRKIVTDEVEITRF